MTEALHSVTPLDAQRFPAAAEGTRATDLTKFADPLRIPPVVRPDPADPRPEITVPLRAGWIRLHSELPPTPAWTYGGSFPGPTIDVRRGQRLRVSWANEVAGPFPLTAVEVPVPGPDAPDAPGRGVAKPLPNVAAIPPFLVTHLHGARTGGGNDGWPENGVAPGDAQLAEYPNDQRATALWYHDHAMGITAFNVMAGLAGTYLVRDEEEDALGLPSGAHEVPLMIADRNVDTDPDGEPTGRMLHKRGLLVSADPEHPDPVKLPFTGPYTTVNGTIWPHHEVEPRWYRFRVLNASNARIYTFALHEVEAGGSIRPVPGAICQIGTDGGLLPAPVRHDNLTLAPAERADILIDFRAFRGVRMRLMDVGPTASPLGGEVMEFRVRRRGTPDPFRLPTRISPSFARLTHDSIPAGHAHRWVAFTPPADGIHPEMWELEHVEPADVPPPPASGHIQVKGRDGEIATFRRAARTFDETNTFFVERDGWEIWNVVNLAPAPIPITHPVHLHLVEFQALRRDVLDVTGFDVKLGGTRDPVAFAADGELGPEERGWKDVIRVAPTELVTIAARFGGASGRFVYHCHLLEHEDEGMMRPFVVAPAEVLAFMPHDGGHHRTPRATVRTIPVRGFGCRSCERGDNPGP